MNLLELSLHLKMTGCSLLLLALMHLFLGARFGWKEEFERVSLLNRQMFYVHCFFIALTVALMGALALFATPALLEKTLLARCVLGGLAFFWACRLFIQFFVYSPDLWRGNAFNTRMHVLFAFLWLYYTLVFGWALWRQWH